MNQFNEMHVCQDFLNLQQGQVESNAFVRLHTLGIHLGDLVSLHTKYNCKLSLADYLKVISHLH